MELLTAWTVIVREKGAQDFVFLQELRPPPSPRSAFDTLTSTYEHCCTVGCIDYLAANENSP